MRFKIMAIDIGGTYIKYAPYENDTLGEVKEVPTPLDSLDSLKRTLLDIVKNEPGIFGVAISMPGFIDQEKGIARTGGYLDYIKDLEVVKELSRMFALPVTVENDAKAAMLAEMKEGALKDVDNAVMLVFGTGLGGALAIDGKIVRGSNLLAGEFSFFSADYKEMGNYDQSLGILCGAKGLSDCVEKTSGLKGLNGREIFSEILENDNQEVYEGLRLFCKRIVWFLYNLEVLTDPEMFAIGGGISRQPLFIETIRKEIDEYSKTEGIALLEKPVISVCKFRAHANLIGAVHNFFNRYGN